MIKRWEEYYAKTIIEGLFPERYENLFVRDKPDLFDEKNRRGIEVTSCIPSKEREVESLWYKTFCYGEQADQTKSIERMKQLGVDYSGGCQFFGEKTYLSQLDENRDNVRCFLDIATDKIRKLNGGGYYEFDEYDLVVLSKMPVLEEWKGGLLSYLLKANVATKKYHYIHLVTNFNIVVSFDLFAKKVSEKNFSEMQCIFAEKAKRMVKNI